MISSNVPNPAVEAEAGEAQRRRREDRNMLLCWISVLVEAILPPGFAISLEVVEQLSAHARLFFKIQKMVLCL